MSLNPSETDPAPRRERILTATLTVFAVLVALATIVDSAMRFSALAEAPEPRSAALTAIIVELVVGLGLSLFFWAAAETLRFLMLLLEGRRTLDAVASAAQPGPMMREIQERLSEMVTLTREMRDIALLDEKERSLRVQTQAAELAQRLESDVPALLHEHNWIEAHRLVQSARERFPSLPNWGALENQIEQARDALERQDMEVVSRQVSDLAMVGAWGRVAEAVRELVQRHPRSPRVAQFAQRIRLERDKAEEAQRTRLIAQARESTERRDWNAALAAVTSLLRDYPASPEADELRQQLPTLTQNAEIQTRRRMEQQIQDHVKSHRYEDALQIARELVASYPHSPQATVLRDQIPKLEQKAAELHSPV